MTIIRAADFIESGFSAEDAQLIIPSIDAVKNADNEAFTLDFSGVQYFTTLFFSSALTRLVGEMGVNAYTSRVHVINLSESGAETYDHALDYAVEYFSKTPEERESEFISIRNLMEDQ
jgi:predicted naringenin-chalcone synthase